MSIKFVYTLLLSLLGVLPFCVPLQFTDSAVAPQPVANYVRYVTFLANGTRTYVCSPGSGSDNYTLTAFDYVLSDAETGTSTPLGKHELMVQKDANGANSIFFTSNGIFTYWSVMLKPLALIRCGLTGLRGKGSARLPSSSPILGPIRTH